MTAAGTSEWTIRPYQEGDEAALLALFEWVFGCPLTQAHRRRKLKQQPAPAENGSSGPYHGSAYLSGRRARRLLRAQAAREIR